MTRLLEIKAIIVGIYKKFDYLINPFVKFLISFIMIVKLNKFFGYSPIFAKLGVNLVIAILAAFLPSSWFLLLLIAVVAAQLFAVSIEVTAIMVLMMLVVYFLFARLQPKYAMLIMLVPLLYSMKLVYLLPLFAGLFLGISSIIPIAVGVGVYRVASYLPQIIDMRVEGSTLFETPDIMINMYKTMMNIVLRDRELYLTIAVFAITIIVMHFLKQLDMDYIWYITIGTGAVTMLVVFIIGNVVLKANIGLLGMFFGIVFSALLMIAIQFFRFSLDYKRSEKLQFEDDDYYYYVHTIPKIKATIVQNEPTKSVSTVTSYKKIT